MKAIQYLTRAMLMLAAGLMISCGGDPGDGVSFARLVIIQATPSQQANLKTEK